MQLILLSGPLAVGKSDAAASLITQHQFRRISSSDYLRGLLLSAGEQTNRRNLQNLGDSLDLSTDFRWLVDDVALPLFAAEQRNCSRWLLDAVRKKRQVDHFKAAVPKAFHVHLTASEETLRQRYEARLLRGHDVDYEEAISHPNERAARELIDVADLVLNVQGRPPEEVAAAILDGGRDDAKDRPN